MIQRGLKTIVRRQQIVARAFSSAARRYDQASGLQRAIGRQLVARIPGQIPGGLILDVGVGTGRVTQVLAERLPAAGLVGLDVSLAMLEQARRNVPSLFAVHADAAALPFGPGCFDLVFSNLAYQWVGDLVTAFGEVRRVLRDDGAVYLTIFTRQTLTEFFASLAATAGGQRGGCFRRLAAADEVLAALSAAGLRVVDQQVEVHKQDVTDMWALLRWLKDTGANALNPGVYVGRQWLTAAGAYYRQHYPAAGGISARFEVLTIVAKR